MTVNTTFLPKTSGLVFGDRLTARAIKGRVFLYTVEGDEIVEPPPSMEPITVTVNGFAYDYKEGAALTVLINDPIPVVITAGASPTYEWSARADKATFSNTTSSSTEITCAAEGLITTTCTLTDNDSLEDSLSVIVDFYSVDAL